MQDPMKNFARIQGRHLMQCWSAQGDYEPIGVDRTEGCWIYTSDGRKIFDLRSAHECINLGFNHPKVIQALKAQMESVIYVTDDFATEPTAKLAKTLAELAPGDPDKRVYFSQSGAAAVEAAIKGARLYKYNTVVKNQAASDVDAPLQYPYPYKIISRYRSWHGATSGAASVSGDPRRWFQEPFTIPGVVFAPDADAYRSRFGEENAVERNIEYLDYIIENEGGNNKVAAILIEPIVGSNGIIPPPPRYLELLRDLCDRWDLLLIADETMSGMGRTGKFFAIEHYDIEPDIIVMGKALGVYCPITATIFSKKVSSVFEDNIFGHGQSFSGHALAAAGALASIDVLCNDGVLENCQQMGEYLDKRLKMLQEKHEAIGDVRGIGLFWTIELVKNRHTREPLRRQTEKYVKTIVRDVAEYLIREKNVYVPTDKFGVWVVPPLIVNKEEIDFIIDAIDEALENVLG